MAIQHMSYTSLPPQQRQAGAKAAKQRLHVILSSPILTQEQRQILLAAVAKIVAWEQGKL